MELRRLLHPAYFRSAGRRLRRAVLRPRPLVMIAAASLIVWVGAAAASLCFPLTAAGPAARQLGWVSQGRYQLNVSGDARSGWRTVLWIDPRFAPAPAAQPVAEHADAALFRAIFDGLPPPPKGMINRVGPADADASPRRFFWNDPLGGSSAASGPGWLQRFCDDHGAVEIVAVGWPRPWLMAVTPVDAVSPAQDPGVPSRLMDAALSHRAAIEQMGQWERTRVGVHPVRLALALLACLVGVAAVCSLGVLARHTRRWVRVAAGVARLVRAGCGVCGYSRAGLPRGARCPECGARD